MSALAKPHLSTFGVEVHQGLAADPKFIPSRYLYNALGLGILETISKLPAPGIDQAQERILRRHGAELAGLLPGVSLVSRVSRESNRCAALVLRSLSAGNIQPRCLPLPMIESAGSDAWLHTVSRLSNQRNGEQPMLMIFLGRMFGMFDSASRQNFLEQLRRALRPGDFFLFSADLVKDPAQMVASYDDPLGLMAAFNKNLLFTINQNLGGHFNPRLFRHSVKWNAFLRRIELHLESLDRQEVYISALSSRFSFRAAETVHTCSAYKLTELELESLAAATGFSLVKTWLDTEFAFATALWAA